MNTKIYFAKTNPNAIIPTKRDEDAGYDIYPCFEEEYMRILPHETVMIPTGIASACDSDYCFVLKERGSTGTKGIAQRCGIIDSGYRGEWFVPITNTSDTAIVIEKKDSPRSHIKGIKEIVYPYEKAITQALVIPVPKSKVYEVTLDKLNEMDSERGNGALGSSNK